MRARVLWIVVMSLGLSACDLEALQPKDEYVAVVGRSTLAEPPNELSFRVVVVRNGETPGETQKKVSADATKLIAALVDFGLETSNFVTEEIFVATKFDDVVVDGQRIEKQVGFMGRYELRITTDKLKELDSILGVVVENSAYYDDLDYSLRDKSKLHEMVRQSAIDNARQKAEQYAAAVGKTLGSAEIVEEPEINRYRLNPNFRRGAFDEIVVTASKRGAGFSVPIIPPRVEVGLEIYVKFRLE